MPECVAECRDCGFLWPPLEASAGSFISCPRCKGTVYIGFDSNYDVILKQLYELADLENGLYLIEKALKAVTIKRYLDRKFSYVESFAPSAEAVYGEDYVVSDWGFLYHKADVSRGIRSPLAQGSPTDT
jgi:hypothetical protein